LTGYQIISNLYPHFRQLQERSSNSTVLLRLGVGREGGGERGA